MSTSSKRSWTAEEKLATLQEARIPGNSVSDVCRRKQVAPAQFYLWEKQARQEHYAEAFAVAQASRVPTLLGLVPQFGFSDSANPT